MNVIEHALRSAKRRVTVRYWDQERAPDAVIERVSVEHVEVDRNGYTRNAGYRGVHSMTLYAITLHCEDGIETTFEVHAKDRETLRNQIKGTWPSVKVDR